MTGRLAFLAARALRREAPLTRLSWPLPDLSGRTVSLVGNARALGSHGHGAEIDAADLVIRINRAPLPAPESHGTRTDWLALAVRLNAADLTRIAPDRILWMSHKRKRLAYRDATSPGFYLHPPEDWRRLRQTLGAPPSTGAMVIDLLARSRAARVTLFGFDFFASQSLSGRRSAAQVPHDFAAEAKWVRDLLAVDPRFALKAL